MNPVHVSIVIPCYRQGRFLAAAIDAALGQTYPSVEVIVVNDGSDDSTDEVARNYGDRITYVCQENRGLPAARNAGIARACGQFLMVLDADDSLHPDAIAWLVEASGGRNDVLSVMGFRDFDEQGTHFPDRFPDEHGVPAATLLWTNLGPPHCYLSPRSLVVREGGFDHNLRSCEDWDLWMRLLFAGAELVSVRRVGAFYRQHPQSMSRNVQRMAQTRVEVMSRARQQAESNPSAIWRVGSNPVSLRHRLREQIANEYIDAAYQLREQGHYAQAFRHFALSLWRGTPQRAALSGICKLLPHRLVKATTTWR